MAAGPGAWWSAPGVTPPAHVPVSEVRAAVVRRGPLVAVPGEDRYHHAPVELHLPGADRRPAAVLCAVWDDAGEASVVLTRRSARLRSHTGEVAFPGGRLDEGETALQAALREAHEEVGIEPAAVEVIGELSPLATQSSRAAVRPYVGILARRPHLRPNPAEVERAFSVALVDLMRPGTYHEERWTFGGGAPPPGDGAPRSIHFFELPGDTVWGATARMLRELLDLVCPPPT